MISYRTQSAPELAERFLRSDVGRATVHRALARRRLPLTLADDLCQDVLRRVVVATAQQAIVVDNVEAFVTAALNRAAVDIVRGRVRSPQVIDRRPGVDLDAGGQGWWFAAIASPIDVEADALAFESAAAVRRAIHRQLAFDITAGAAGLAYLAVMLDGARPSAACPQPDGGAGHREAAQWIGLWYAGADDCFPGPTADETMPAVRKRRSRAAARFHGMLVRAAVSVGLAPEQNPTPRTGLPSTVRSLPSCPSLGSADRAPPPACHVRGAENVPSADAATRAEREVRHVA